MLGDEHDQDADLSLELCLGRPEGFGQSRRGGEHHKVSVKDRVVGECRSGRHGYNDGKEMIMAGDDTVGAQIELGLDNHRTDGGALIEEVDPRDVPERLWNMSLKTAASVELPVAGYVPAYSSASLLRELSSDEAECLSNAHVGGQWKNAVYQQHVVDQPQKNELHVQKRQAARKKRKTLTVEQNFQELQSPKSRPFLRSSTHSESSLYTQKSVEQDNVLDYQKEGACEALLERTNSEASIKIEREQPIIPQEERASSHENTHLALQRERDTTATDKELMFGFGTIEDNESNLPRQSSTSDRKALQLVEQQNELETAQWTKKFHELRKMTSPNTPTITEMKIPALDMISDLPLDTSQTNYRNADQNDILITKAETSVIKSKKASASDKGLKSKEPKSMKDQRSTRDKTTDSTIIRLEAEVAIATALSQSLPTASFIPMPFAFPPHASNIGGFSYPPVPYFMPYVVAQPLGIQGESPFTSYQFFMPPGSTPFQMATLEKTAGIGTPVLQPNPVRHPPIFITKQRKSPHRSQKKEQKYLRGGATLLPTKPLTLCVPSEPPLPGPIFSESKGRNWLDHANSNALSGTSSGIQEEVATSGQSSSSSGIYQSAHGETVESYPITEMNVQATKGHGLETTTETAAHTGLPSNDGPLVSTTANGKTINGVLYAYSKGEVKIRCKCHGKCMNAGEFVVHAGGVDDPHPERSILVNSLTN
ncbi:hypothetical protein O6H91_21G024100 [Diphasiastrum complanatum]|uniref:Uncharacterized protein n=1 Tax=Diphasiastrum complanatum TaxID=34168 RepID=A0ACC2AJ06_DIPCM|nr:hypothetical protein O6H91_21G024100 [Diphasiastrum complanatum]